MDCSRIIISHHALRRFKQRWPKYAIECWCQRHKREIRKNSLPSFLRRHPEYEAKFYLRDWAGEIRRLLFRAEERRRKPRALQAEMARHGNASRCFVRNDWIFLLNERLDVVITVWYDRNHKKRP